MSERDLHDDADSPGPQSDSSQAAEELALRSRPAFSLRNRLGRLAWGIVWTLFFRFSPRLCYGWRDMLLRAFGAKLGRGCHIYPQVVIWAPWNLECGDGVAIANGAEVYNPSLIVIGDLAVISQGAYLCGASHDYRDREFPLTTLPIHIGARAWVAARSIVLMGVTIGEGCVIGAGSVVTRDMPPLAVCGGNPCRVIRMQTSPSGVSPGDRETH